MLSNVFICVDTVFWLKELVFIRPCHYKELKAFIEVDILLTLLQCFD